MPGENWIHERVVGLNEIEHRTIVLHDIDEELDRLSKHRLAQFVVETLEALAVHAVVFFEAPEIEPIAAELGGKSADAIVLEHPPRLRQEHFALMQIADLRVRQEFRVRHAGPEEITEPAREFVVGQWLYFPF